jgi:hypothetical protein
LLAPKFCRYIIVLVKYSAIRSMAALLVIFAAPTIGSLANQTWFNQRVTWKYGKEGLGWKTTINKPDGQGEYQLVLQPFWAVEGGVLAIEIVVAQPRQPEVNLLGQRENGIEYPFVITVEELERGMAHSKFGAVRTLQVNDITLNVKIERFRLGKGVGSGSTYCSKCNNLQELSMWVTVESAGAKRE